MTCHTITQWWPTSSCSSLFLRPQIKAQPGFLLKDSQRTEAEGHGQRFSYHLSASGAPQ